ncbi:amino acid adenylation domain-containing protein [Streptomyces sp. NBC_01092]|uniref:amino acid adenylation domain-containing protein n=1 Tax=Streptomyces sp. NBC_01092 TaxID=2903748 RepID=UPI0038636D61|nr:amino acid adenylation domain-containing protein [Streptomyces sp. NBC_01092]
MGADSLLLLSILQPLEERYGCKLSMRQFFREFQTLDELADYLTAHADQQRLPNAAAARPAEAAAPVPAAPAVPTRAAVPVPAPVPLSPAPAGSAAVATDPAAHAPQPVAVHTPAPGAPMSAIERIAAEQLKLMGRQLELLQGHHTAAPVTDPAPQPAVLPAAQAIVPSAAALTRPPTPAPATESAAPAPKVPLAPRMRAAAALPADTQSRKEYLDGFIKRFSERTRKSKDYAQRFRPAIADSRSTIGFRMSTKELLYPIVAEQGRRAKLWDLDGNEYVDLTMGFGVHLFGHQYEPIVDSLRERMDVGFGLGPRTELAEEVASAILELTGMERVAFVNTGSEAVMNAVRLARAATKRDKIVIFSTGYHGHADGVLAAPTWVDGDLRTKPIATGVTQRSVQDVYVLEFGTEEALNFIDRHGGELAAVMVEPVTTRHPGDQQPEFLRALRRLTYKHGAKLIFDEMVTGFRTHPGGIQGLWDIQADICTYGKVIGGGLPLGVVAGRGGVMDAIDGGVWHFGDDSFPTVESTFFGGTFCQHPLSMIAAKTVLDELRAKGPALQAGLAEKTARFTDALNADFKALEVPITVDRFTSLFRFEHDANMDLFFYNLLDKGVYIWEWRCCFLSTSHDEDDLTRVRRAISDSVGELREHKLLPPLSAAASAPPVPALPAAPAAAAPAPSTAAADTSAGAASFPAGRAHKQLWALANLNEGGSLAYNLNADFWLDGPLDEAALRTAVTQLVARHESLRMTMSADGETILVRAAADVPPDTVLHLTEAADDAALTRLLDELAERHFDLLDGPLFRVTVIRTAPERHLLHLAVHHLAADGWSTVPALGDLATLYNAARAGIDVGLAPVAQLSDFLAHQGRNAAAPEAAEHRAYWTEITRDAPETELPGDAQHTLPTFRSERRTLHLEGELLRTLRREAAAQGVTVFAYLVTAWGALLQRLLDQQEVMLLVPSAARAPEFSDTVGYCTNLLPLRFRVDGATQIGTAVDAVQGQLLDAMDHEAHPFADTVHALDRESGRPGRAGRIFRTVLVFDREVPLPRMDGLRMTEARKTPVRHAIHPLFVTVTDTGSGYRCDFDTQLESFSDAVTEQLPTLFRNLLAEMTADSGQSLSALDLVDAEERAGLLRWGRGPDVELGSRTVSELIEEQTARTPDGRAVACEDRTLTYAQLDDRANRLATALRRRLDIGPETVVGIRLPRSEDFLVTILALWKCGAAYVPLEPRHPLQRHEKVLSLSNAVAVISEAAHEPERPTGEVTWLRHSELLAETPQADTDTAAAPRPMDAAAYIMFSSGSTGEPKGIVIEQRAMLNHILAKIEDYKVDDGDGVLAQNAPSSFDISVWQFVAPLLGGGTVRVYPDSVVEDPAAFIDLVDRHAVTVLELVPSYLALMLDELDLSGRTGLFRSLHHVVLQAEPLKPQLVARWYERFPDIVMSNAYGATETADDVLHPVTPVPDGDLTPTGKPIRNASVYIVGDDFQLLPPGVRGELLVAGIPVGRGYLTDSPAGAHAFLDHNPVEPERPGRVYRTGDMARWREDGQIEILGRSDHQVKVRGQRVELGEIERTLHTLPQIADAVVRNFPEPNGGGSYLVAYAVAAQGADTASERLRADLRDRLPDYMVPAHVVLMDALPLNDSGKVDRKALEEPRAFTGRRSAATPPRHHVDEAVLKCARTIFGHSDIGMDDDFFELGGNSISAVRLIQLVREAFGIALPGITIFERPKLREFADAVAARVFDPLAPIPRSREKDAYWASASEERMYFLWTLDPESRLYNIPMAYVVRGTVEHARLRRAINDVVAKHDILRTTFHMENGRLLQRVLPSADVALADLGINDESLEDLVDAWAEPHNLRVGPPIRAGLARRPGREEYVVLLDLPHIVLDEGSMGVLFRDLSAAYRGEKLEPAQLTYKDFAEWEQLYRTSPAYADDRSYWLERFQNPPSPVPFPLRPRPAVLEMKGSRHSFTLDAGLTARLREHCRTRRVTPYMVLLSAFKLMLSKYTGRQELVVGTPVDGRYHPACADIIGMFGNSLPLRTAPDADKTFGAYVDEVRAAVIDGLHHQAYPFEELVRELNLPRDPSRNPLFDFMFVFTDLAESWFEMDGAIGTPEPVSIGVAKMDMTFSAYEREDTVEVIQEYAVDVFDEDTVEQMGRHYTRLLEQALAAPDAPMGGHRLVTDEERAALTTGTAGPAATHPVRTEGPTLHALFEAAVDGTPDRTALVSGAVRLTYAELDERANRLAHLLRADLGVRPQQPVGILLATPHDTVTAMLAVLKAGGAYVPFDRSTPTARVTELLDSAEAGVLVSDLADAATVPDGITLVAPDDDRIAGRSGERPEPLAGAQDLAYIMFTSGSTGRPKGVLVEHASLRRITHDPDYVPLTPGDRVLQATSWGFDVSAASMYTALLNGATLVCPSYEELLDVESLHRLVKAEEVDLAFFSTGYFHLLSDVSPQCLDPIGTLVVAGERLSADHARRVVERGGPGRLINAYGPTEGTVYATAHRVDKIEDDAVSVPIGTPVDDTRVYLLMPQGEPAPDGIAGELCIAGTGVARGYLGAGDATDGPFQPDPFVEGERMYRTGDLARRLPGGALEFMGRTDDQLKIRGFRVEPAEVEEALRGCPGVTDARVVARDLDGEKRLCAYLVSDDESVAEAARTHLRDRLPSYLQPHAFVVLERLPLNASGKVDRHALPLPTPGERSVTAPSTGGTAARTETERKVLDIWARSLATESPGLDDNFFEAGGHSLKAVALMAEVREAFGVEVRLMDFFPRPTARGLAEHIDNLRWLETGAAATPSGDTEEFYI